MSARLSTAIKIGDAANGILRRVKSFDKKNIFDTENWEDRDHIGIDPMLLALSMELALKAWYVFDFDTPDVKRSHNLLKLYSALLPESQKKLAIAFRETVAPYHMRGFYMNYGIEDVLAHHANAFVDWRYIHEAKNISFNESAFVATLEMVIREFRKRYRTVKHDPIWPHV